jgi:hypothetical protein
MIGIFKTFSGKLRTYFTVGTLACVLPAAVQAADPLRVRYDPGGSVRERIMKIQEIEAQNRPVEIRFGYCASACTMYLGTSNVCVSPSAVLVFHGPQPLNKPGEPRLKKLDDETFELASKVVIQYYPEFLRDWYLETGRYGLHTLSGRELIKHGIRKCGKII